MDKRGKLSLFSLGCAVILFACGCLLWKKEWKNTGVMSSVLKSWYGLWIMMALSDVFKEDGEKFFSYVMIFSAGFFILRIISDLKRMR